ncbi:MAG: FtsX-like permease family protein [Agarilytica sp.]
MNVTLALAWRNLWRHKRRTWLTVGAMIFSNFLLVFMIAVQFGSYDMMIENSLKAFSGHIQIAHSGYASSPKMRAVLANVQPLANDLRAEWPEMIVSARAESFALASSEKRSLGIQISGVDPVNEPLVSTIPGLIIKGQYLSDSFKDEMIIGYKLAKNLKVDVGDELTLVGSGLDGSFAALVVSIVGVFETGIPELDRMVGQMSLSRFQEHFSMGEAGHSVIVNLPSITLTDNYQARILQFSDIDESVEVLTWYERHPEIRQAIQSDMVSAWFMYAVLVILVSFSVLNTQLMSVLERTREFGIMMAIGLSAGRLARLVMVEAFFMAVLGFLIGSMLGIVLVVYLHNVGFSFPGMSEMAAQYNLPERMYPSLSPLAIFLGPSIVFLGSILAAVYPALRLTFLQPIAAMRAV